MKEAPKLHSIPKPLLRSTSTHNINHHNACESIENPYKSNFLFPVTCTKLWPVWGRGDEPCTQFFGSLLAVG